MGRAGRSSERGLGDGAESLTSRRLSETVPKLGGVQQLEKLGCRRYIIALVVERGGHCQ